MALQDSIRKERLFHNVKGSILNIASLYALSRHEVTEELRLVHSEIYV